MKRVVILGGGFGGVETALRLKKLNSSIEILLITEDDCFTFIPALYETAAGEADESDVCILMSSLLNQKGIIYYHDKIESVNLKKKQVKTKGIGAISYDYLVMAVGAEPNYFNIPGCEKYAFNLKTKDEAQRIYSNVDNILRKKKKHNFVVCGAGLTGVEFTGALVDHIKKSCRKYKCKASNFKVTLIDASPTVLYGLPPKAGEFATSYLENKGVRVVTNAKISRFSKSFLMAGGMKIPYDMAIWCGGLKTHRLLIKSKIPYSGKAAARAAPGGGMKVNDYLQLVSDKTVFGVGDCISKKSDVPPVLKTAQNAIHESRTVAYNINAMITRKKLRKYISRNNQVYCSIGSDMGIFISPKGAKPGKQVKKMKDKLEAEYVANLRKGKLSKTNIYS